MKEMLSDEGYDEDEFEDELGEEEAEQLEDPVLPAGAAACGEFRQDIPRIGKSNSISPNFWHYVKGFEAWILNIELFESSDGVPIFKTEFYLHIFALFRSAEERWKPFIAIQN